ncbi:MAG: NAD(P)/FAD-dependent oxidoreductase [Bacillota bacterium]|nr:MAG: NAD(P)/FAD-dependent oxidoreductase [Bacillota bacterium]
MMHESSYDVIIVGGGIAGLTAANYLSKTHLKVCLMEKEKTFGGNILSFNYQGHVLDGGIRSIESSGVLKPMIQDLDLNVTLVKSPVTLGIKDDVISLNDLSDIASYESLLIKHFPENASEIKIIVKKIKRILKKMDVLYGIDNPMIVDFKKRPGYALSLIPWFFKFVPTILSIDKLTLPVENYLSRYTKNQALIDVIAQHFFKATPTFFALGYFSIYFDYHYPLGGTGALIKALEDRAREKHVTLLNETTIKHIVPNKKIVKDDKDHVYHYQKLIWAADLKALYQGLEMVDLTSSTSRKINHQKALMSDKRGAESVLTVYLETDLDTNYFKKIHSGHFFYTPLTEGKHSKVYDLSNDQTTLFETLKTLYNLETYEISIPALRDPSLSPKGKTGLIVSILCPFDLIKHVSDCGFYEAFKVMTEAHFVEVLSSSIYPGLKDHVLSSFSSTPITFQKRTHNTDGAIIGWAYDSKPIPVHHQMSRIMKSIQTPIPHIYQAGQWSFSPAGVPISIITGKLAADRVKKSLKTKGGHQT